VTVLQMSPPAATLSNLSEASRTGRRRKLPGRSPPALARGPIWNGFPRRHRSSAAIITKGYIRNPGTIMTVPTVCLSPGRPPAPDVHERLGWYWSTWAINGSTSMRINGPISGANLKWTDRSGTRTDRSAGPATANIRLPDCSKPVMHPPLYRQRHM